MSNVANDYQITALDLVTFPESDTYFVIHSSLVALFQDAPRAQGAHCCAAIVNYMLQNVFGDEWMTLVIGDLKGLFNDAWGKDTIRESLLWLVDEGYLEREFYHVLVDGDRPHGRLARYCLNLDKLNTSLHTRAIDSTVVTSLSSE